MLINMRNALMAGKRLSAKSYVQDGLVAMWDGIENAGWGVHDPNATTWFDLAYGKMNDFATTAGIGGIRRDYEYCDLAFDGNAAVSNGTTTYIEGPPVDVEKMDGITISVCADLTANDAGFGVGWTLAGVYRRPCIFGTRSSGNISCYAQNTNNITTQSFSGSCHTIDATFTNPIPGSTTPQTGNEGFKTLYLNGNYKTASPNGADYNIKNNAGERPTYQFFRIFAYGASSRNQTNHGNNSYYKSKVYNIRIYSRALTAAEVAANYAVDKARFRLPDAT